MQFSKYGQEHQPDPPLPTDNAHHKGKHTPSGHHHQKFGEGWPQPHHHTNHNPQGLPAGTASDPEKPEQPVNNQAGPIPQDPTARLDNSLDPSTFHTHPQKKGASSTSFNGSAARLMVNVPQSEAPPPQDRRLRNDE
jgi:hypothetical protein